MAKRRRARKNPFGWSKDETLIAYGAGGLAVLGGLLYYFNKPAATPNTTSVTVTTPPGTSTTGG